MARDWTEVETTHLLEDRLAKLADGNTAEFPISCSKQKNDLGEWVWVVDIHVRIPRVTEYEVTGFAPTLAGALRRAYLGMNSEALLRKNSNAANLQFGVAV